MLQKLSPIVSLLLLFCFCRTLSAQSTSASSLAVEESPLLFDATRERTAEDVQTAQKAWANHLKLDVEITNSLGMKLRFIPPGKFLMGTTDVEPERFDREKQHRVTLAEPYYIGVYEVTQKEWEDLMGSNPSYFAASGDGKENVTGIDTSRFPVERITWDEARTFCEKLSEKEKKRYRLATEAEWEYACRAGTQTPFHFGTSLNGDNANSNGQRPYGIESKGTFLERTCQVGSYSANHFGLYDFHGNVWEWCSDFYGEDYYRNSPEKNPENQVAGSYRVLRGGSWYYVSRNCRSGFRDDTVSPTTRYSSGGFRVVRECR